MPPTYEAIATQTLGSATASVTFSSIPSTYTDLVLVVNTGSGTAEDIALRFNSDTGTNYSRTYFYGNGTVTYSDKNSNVAFSYFGGQNSTTTPVTHIANIMNYSNSTTFKSMLVKIGSASSVTSLTAHLWRSTSTITTIGLFTVSGNNLNAGSTFTLYGIKAA